jgi:hypothetical protein
MQFYVFYDMLIAKTAVVAISLPVRLSLLANRQNLRCLLCSRPRNIVDLRADFLNLGVNTIEG